jgi:Skp family chaperone for outer membrane proteins
MKSLSLACLALCVVAAANPAAVRAQESKEYRIATLDFFNVYHNYWETKQLFSTLTIKKKQHDTVLEEKRTAWRKLKTELEKIEAQLADPVLSEQKKTEMRKEGAEKYQLMRKIEQEAAEYAQLAQNDLQALESRRRREIIEKIRRLIEQKAREYRYSLVLDISGLTSHEIPVVLFSDRHADLTDEILKILNANAPLLPPEPPANQPTVQPPPAVPNEKIPEKTPEKAPEQSPDRPQTP